MVCPWLRHPTPCPLCCGCLRLGNCQAAIKRLTETIHAEGKRGKFLNQNNHTVPAPPFIIVLLCFTWQLQSHAYVASWTVLHLQAPIHRGGQEFSSPTWGYLSLNLGGPYSLLTYQRSFPEHANNLTNLKPDVCITAFSMSPWKLSPYDSFSALWPPVSATGDTELTINQQFSTWSHARGEICQLRISIYKGPHISCWRGYESCQGLKQCLDQSESTVLLLTRDFWLW